MRVFKVKLDSVDKASHSEAYDECGMTIREGGLVAFPTETVYGLGADGFNKDALITLFKAKKRPLNDPVILHVASGEASFELWDVTDSEERVIRKLQQAFWPGPCTIVARQSKLVPDEATAASGFASSRMPSHPVALRLIESAQCPIAGPSANLFGRITPTKASHVKKYFLDTNIDLLECDDCCGVGIESTVVKVCQNTTGQVVVQILRHGAVTPSMISSEVATFEAGVVVEDGKIPYVASESEACQSPGQLLRHYAPTAHTCLLLHEPTPGSRVLPHKSLASAILIDVTNEYNHLQEEVFQYRVISESNDSQEIARELFKALHEAEAKAESSRSDEMQPHILIGVNASLMKGLVEELRGVYDRLFRAATGETVHIE